MNKVQGPVGELTEASYCLYINVPTAPIITGVINVYTLTNIIQYCFETAVQLCVCTCLSVCTCILYLLLQLPDEEKGEQREPSDEGEREEEEEEAEEDESEDEETPLIKFQKKPNQFLKALLAFWPFGEAFRELGVFNKIIEIIKVS